MTAMSDLLALALSSQRLLRGTLMDICLVLEVITLFFSIRAYQKKRTEPFRFLMWAFSCLVISQIGVLVLGGVVQRYRWSFDLWWLYLADRVFFALFLLFMILFIRSFVCERSASTRPASNQS